MRSGCALLINLLLQPLDLDSNYAHNVLRTLVQVSSAMWESKNQQLIAEEMKRIVDEGRAGGTASRTSRPGGPGQVRGLLPEQRGVFLLGNDFNTCYDYDATLIFLCARV